MHVKGTVACTRYLEKVRTCTYIHIIYAYMHTEGTSNFDVCLFYFFFLVRRYMCVCDGSIGS
jgi:hypothetical protein